MSAQRESEPFAREAQLPEQAPDVVARGGNRPRVRFTVGSEIPAVCTDRDLMDILGIGHTAYCRRKNAGQFLPLLLPNPNGTTRGATYYAGHLVNRWRRGELVATTPVRKFFASVNRGRPRLRRADEAAGTARVNTSVSK